jgi:hypothetical protein
LIAPYGSGCTRNDLAGNGHFVLKKPIQLRLSFGQLGLSCAAG